MGYLQFPSDLTEEELQLQSAYTTLKRKKNALQDYLKRQNLGPERFQQVASNGRDAREVATKLLKSGVIAAIKTKKRPEESFKRSRALEKKLNSTEKTDLFSVSSYQPFSTIKPDTNKPKAKRQKVKTLSDNFVPSTDPANKVCEKSVSEPEAKPLKGNTIFVYGYKLSKEFLTEHFSAFGTIIQIVIENKKRGFVTFEKPESAREAINKMDGMKISSIVLQVSMAKKQLAFDPLVDNAASYMWLSATSDYSIKGKSHPDKRHLITYDNIF